MIKIKELKVQNFKSLINTHIEEFDTVNMFYGFNNSGKSNVFKFLHLLFTRKKEIQVVTSIEDDSNSALSKKSKETLVNTADFWNGYIYNEPYIFSNNNRTKNIDFEVTIEVGNSLFPKLQLLKDNGFIAEGDTSKLILKGKIKSLNSKDSKLEVTYASLNNKDFHVYDDEIHYGFKELNITGLDSELASNILNIANDLIEFIDTDRNFIKEIFNDESIELNHHNFKNWLFELNMNAEKNETFQGLAKFLSGFEFSTDGKNKLSNNINSFPFREFTDIGFTRFGNEIEIMLKNNKNRLPLSSFGSGIQQFFFILTRIYMNKSKIIIIEEIELNLSPLYQKELLAFIKTLLGKNFDQLLFSSHSPFFTLKDSDLIDVIQHVQIDNTADAGTNIESHSEWHYFEDGNHSLFSLCYS
jgi:AAA15 family ATPase/GTPase